MVSPSFSLPIFLPLFLHFTSNTPLTFCHKSWLDQKLNITKTNRGTLSQVWSVKGRDLWRKMYFQKNVHYNLTFFFFFKLGASQNKWKKYTICRVTSSRSDLSCAQWRNSQPLHGLLAISSLQLSGDKCLNTNQNITGCMHVRFSSLCTFRQAPPSLRWAAWSSCRCRTGPPPREQRASRPRGAYPGFYHVSSGFYGNQWSSGSTNSNNRRTVRSYTSLTKGQTVIN